MLSDGEFLLNGSFVVGAGFLVAEEARHFLQNIYKSYYIAREPEFTCAKSIAERFQITLK